MRRPQVPVVHVVAECCTPDVVGVHSLDVGELGLRELQTGGPVVLDNVLDLLGDRFVVQRWQEGQGLEHPAFAATTQVNN